MVGRWSEDYNDPWRGEAEFGRERWDGAEERAFGRRAPYGPPRPEARASGGRPAWQDRHYEGVSPAFQSHENDYEREHPDAQAERPVRGGRYCGDDGRGRIYREAYGHVAAPYPEEGRRFGAREADERWERATQRASPSGTSRYGYDRGHDEHEGFEDRAREAGDFFRRTGRKVADWFGDVAGEGAETGRQEVGSHRGKGPRGYKRSDERISDDIHQRLTDDHWLDASDIDIAVSNGEVTLAGSVTDREAKHHAERLVEHLSGVTHVQNNLRVKPGYGGSGGRAFGDVVAEAHQRTEGDAATETSANAHNTTTRRN